MSEKGNCVRCGNDAPYVCGDCGYTYCSKSCQKVDWHDHRHICFRTPKLVPFAKLNYVKEDRSQPLQEVSGALRNNCTGGDNLIFNKNDRNVQYKSANENEKRIGNGFEKQQQQKFLPKNHNDQKKTNLRSGNVGNYGRNGSQIINNVGEEQHNKSAHKYGIVNTAQQSDNKNSIQYRYNAQSRRSSHFAAATDRYYGDQQYCNQQSQIQVLVQKVNPGFKEKMYGVLYSDENHQQHVQENQKRNQQKHPYNEDINKDDRSPTQEASYNKQQLERQSSGSELQYKNNKQDFNAPVLNPPFEIIKFTESCTNFEAVIINKSCIGDGMFACIPNLYCQSFMKMQSFLVKIKKDGPPYKPVLHEYCIALFEGEWYRTKVIAVKGTEIQVEYIDFANEDCLKIDHIRQYPSELTAVCSTNLCKLAGLPKVLDPELLNHLDKIVVEFQKVYVKRVVMNGKICEIECPVLLKKLQEFGFI